MATMNHPYMSSLSAYRGKKVLITGHTGFKGTWLLLWLELLGARVAGYALAPENEDLYSRVDGDKRCASTIADVRDRDRLCAAVAEFAPDFIFHLAAQPLVRDSYVMPALTFETNIQGTVNLLEAVRELRKPCTVVVITTDKVYHNIESDYYYREDDRLGGYDPYSASKACAELVVSSYRNSFFNSAAFPLHQKSILSARAGNVIGGGDYSRDRIIPDIVRALEARLPVLIRNPKAVRPWQHVLEPLFGYLRLALAYENKPSDASDAWNFGPRKGDELAVLDIVRLAIDSWGEGSYELAELPDAPHEAGLLMLDTGKALDQLNWQGLWNAKEAVAATIRWYKDASPDYAAYCRRQIDEYMTSYAV